MSPGFSISITPIHFEIHITLTYIKLEIRDSPCFHQLQVYKSDFASLILKTTSRSEVKIVNCSHRIWVKYSLRTNLSQCKNHKVPSRIITKNQSSSSFYGVFLGISFNESPFSLSVFGEFVQFLDHAGNPSIGGSNRWSDPGPRNKLGSNNLGRMILLNPKSVTWTRNRLELSPSFASKKKKNRVPDTDCVIYWLFNRDPCWWFMK